MGFGMQIANDLLAPPIDLADSRSGRGAYAARALAVRLYYQGLGRRPDARTDGWSAYRFKPARDAGTGAGNELVSVASLAARYGERSMSGDQGAECEPR
jgi:hypothetical protein